MPRARLPQLFLAALPALVVAALAPLAAQPRSAAPNWTLVEPEALDIYQSLIRFDSSVSEKAEADWLKALFDKHGVPAEMFALDPKRPNVVARLKGNGSKRPLLILGHLDTVTVDATKWTFPPFSATRDGGFVYGRGAIDDKDNLASAVMTMLLLQRLNVPLDRDVILLAESGEEGQSNLGIGHMMAEHYDRIDAEFCIAEGGDTIREKGEVRYATVQVIEKISRGIELTAKGISGHGSVPLTSNPIAHLGNAVGTFVRWQPDVKFDETTGRYFRRLATLAATPEQAKAYRDVVSADPQVAAAAADWMWKNEPRHASMARTSVSPNIFTGGYRSNVIPSDATARLDVRMVPSENPEGLLAQVKKAINDPAVDVRFAGGGTRPTIAPTRLDGELFTTAEAAVQAVYRVPTLPSMSTYATDMWPLRAKGVQCIGIGAGVDLEDQSAGYGMHADQERLRESEYQRFVRLNWELVTRLAAAR
jgi:acetylornithine deacetylase/succinyl-diaminopimelate desuccinylase-like protein